jgi:hypothetical protein
MEKLSSGLQAEIANRPTQTILRSENEKVNQEYIEIKDIHPIRKVEVPDSFDGRKAWQGLLSPVKNQGNCGSCWAFASTSMLADRFNIQSLGLLHLELSPTKLILCDWQGKELDVSHPDDQLYKFLDLNLQAFQNSACFGNTLIDACRYLYLIGTTTEKCVPYNMKLGIQKHFQAIGSFENVSQLPLCSEVTGPLGDMCSDFYIDNMNGEELGTPARFYKALNFYGISDDTGDTDGTYNIRNNIFKWGPLASGMQVFPDFYTFNAKTDIYTWNGEGPQVGGHAIEIVGWGESETTKYWIIKNSWGRDWGRDGYFYMKRGSDMCQIESNCIGVTPDFFYPFEHTDTIYKYFSEHHSEVEAQKDILKTKYNITTHLDTKAGGIDTTNGYTRRVINKMPWLNITPPIDYHVLPKWETFVAGKDATVEKRAIFKAKVRQQNSVLSYSKQSMEIYVTVSIILIIAICVILFLIWLQSRK